jgi:hypothetical protein
MSGLRSEYSKALNAGMQYSEWAGRQGRRMVWRNTGYTYNTVERLLKQAGLGYTRIHIATPESHIPGRRNHYVRVYR